MNKRFLLLPIVLISLSACGNKPTTSEPSTSEEEPLTYRLSFDAKGLNKEGATEKYKVSYDINYFEDDFVGSGLTYNPNLALLSLASSLSQERKDLAEAFYTTLAFDNVTYSPEYDTAWDKDTVLYTFAHKQVEDKEVIAVAVNGFEYKQAWESNFIWGKEGNASGFENAATKLRSAFDTYFESYKNNNPTIWITGYSRSAAISGIFLENLLEEHVVSEEQVSAYLFEAPGTMVEENIHNHPSIRNIVNSADFVANSLPKKFGFKRPGIDLDIYSTSQDTIVSSFYNSDLSLAPFKSSKDYADEVEFIDYFYNNILLKEISGEDAHDASTRENYVDNYESSISYVIGLFFSLKEETITAIRNEFNDFGILDYLSLLSEDGIYDFLKPILDTYEETYDDAMLKTATNRLGEFLRNNSGALTRFATNSDFKNNLLRVGELHSPEVVLPLLVSYNNLVRQ